MKYSLLLLPFLVSTAVAQDDIWKSLSKGDRVSITFRSGNAIQGQLTAKPADPRIPEGPLDFSQMSEITIDVSLEYPGLNGTLSIPRKEIKEIRKLQNLDKATMDRINAEILRIRQQAAADEAARRAIENEKDVAVKKARADADKLDKSSADLKSKGAAAVKDLEDLQKGLDLLKKFPPGQYGPDTAKTVADKALRKQPVTALESEFLDPETQRLWNKALDYQKAQEKEKSDGK
ncbi:MAG TPA: hypothetical protein VG457_19370 [Planctomycetota bacterium]|jgi:hypothetical protein|nr:hypothetical protein [Planctomycetota bacterium]